MMFSSSLARVLLALALALSIAACGRKAAPTPTPAPSPTATAPGSRVFLPADDAAHPGVNTEWWYFNGSLQTAAGERFSFHYVVFDVRYPGIKPMNIYHVAFTDHQLGTYATDQRATEPSTQPSGARGFVYRDRDWNISGHDGKDHLFAAFKDYTFDLELESRKPPALHGGAGWLDFGPGASTYYYSRTRMAVSGTLDYYGKTSPVKGEAWFDHQWGDFQPLNVAWDWFALQLGDGSEIMAYKVRLGPTAFEFASVVQKDGTVRSLSGADFQVTPSGSWTSPLSRGVYPMGWRMSVPSLRLDVALEPVIQTAEFDASATTFNYYWEGPASVTGSHPGVGFVELVGYAPLRFPSR